MNRPGFRGGQFYEGEDIQAKQAVRKVLETIVYFPVDLGSLAVEGRLSELPFGNLATTNFIKI